MVGKAVLDNFHIYHSHFILLITVLWNTIIPIQQTLIRKGLRRSSSLFVVENLSLYILLALFFFLRYPYQSITFYWTVGCFKNMKASADFICSVFNSLKGKCPTLIGTRTKWWSILIKCEIQKRSKKQTQKRTIV